MASTPTEVRFGGRIVMVGFGTVGQGVLPLLLRHIELRPDQIVVIKPHIHGLQAAQEYGVTSIVARITEENLRQVLEPQLREGDFLLNLSVDVSSAALMTLCREKGALYLDTCIEPWERWRATQDRLARCDLPHAPGCRHTRSHLDAAGRPDPRLSRHAPRIDFDRRPPDARRCGQADVSSNGALRLPPV